jgi:hypothetical protein
MLHASKSTMNGLIGQMKDVGCAVQDGQDAYVASWRKATHQLALFDISPTYLYNMVGIVISLDYVTEIILRVKLLIGCCKPPRTVCFSS